MQKTLRRGAHLLAIVGWLATVGMPIAPAAEPPQSGSSLVVPMAADGVQRATVLLDSYAYSPSHLIVEAGKPVELTLTSVTTMTPHNFVIKGQAGNLFVEQEVSAGKTVTIRFTPIQPGLSAIYCDKRLWPLPSHRDKGMEGTLEVR